MKISALFLTAAICALVLIVAHKATEKATEKINAPAQAAKKAKDARIALKLKCLDLRKMPTTKLSAADRSDIATCTVWEAEDFDQAVEEATQDRARGAKAQAEEDAQAARILKYDCERLADTKIADMTPKDLAILTNCNAR